MTARIQIPYEMKQKFILDLRTVCKYKVEFRSNVTPDLEESFMHSTCIGIFLSFQPPYGPPLFRVVAWSPNNTIFRKLMHTLSLPMPDNKYADNITFVPVATAEDLEALLKQNRSIIAGIQFHHPNVSYIE